MENQNQQNGTITNYRELFEYLYLNEIHRENADSFLVWLQNTDFFEAPASSKFHLSEPEGLVKHSINVYNQVSMLNRMLNLGYAEETLAIVGLLHDVCKINMYVEQTRNRKNAQGQWETYTTYVVDDLFPFGHGEKSTYLISQCFPLTEEEAIAIRWHMGAFDETVKGGGKTINRAFERYPLAVILHVADLLATYITEVETEQK